MRYFADKIIYDKYEPKNTNVIWVQPTEEGAQIKAYIDGEWQLIGYDHDAYRKPASGIPESDLEESVRNAIDNAQHLDGKIDAEQARAESAEGGLDERLGIVEQLADISISGGDATIATASDFNNPTVEQKAYIPTVGAILDGADTTPTAGSDNLVKSGGVYVEETKTMAQLYRSCEDVGITSAGVYYVNTGRYLSLIIHTAGASNISIEKNKNRYSSYAFLKSIDTIETGVTADFCDGTSITNITQEGKMDISIPSDCSYLYVLLRYDADDYSPALLGVDGSDMLADIANIKMYVDNSDTALSSQFDRKIDSILNGTSINQPTLSDVMNKYLSVNGYWGTPNYSLLVDVSLIRGYHITQSSTAGGQYAFLKSYNDNAADFVDGGGRISGTLNNTLVPNDANYLYLYLGNNTPSSVPTITIDDASIGINNEIDNLKEVAVEVGGIIDAVDKLNWPAPVYSFALEENSTATLLRNIVLSQNGDSIEFQLVSCAFQNFASLQGYAFTRGGGASKIGIGVTSNVISIRADDNTWIVNEAHTTGGFVGKSLKLSYENDNICFYVGNELISTYTGQKTLTILSFGDGSTYGYWSGSITNLKVNGEDYDLRQMATMSNVTVTQYTSFLTEEEKEMIYDEGTPTMMAEKTETSLTVYKKLYANVYVGYPLNYRYSSYSAGSYPSYYDNWGIGRPFIAQYENGGMTLVVYLFSAAEAEVAISVPRGDGQSGDVYVGGSAHGFENIATGTDGREFCIMVDDMKCGETDTFALKEVSSVHVIQGTNLVQAYTNFNPFAYVTKKWDFEKNSYFSITSKATILRSITIALCQFGMFGVYRHYDGNSSNGYLTNKAVKDSQPYKVFSVVDGWEDDSANASLRAVDYDCNKITEYGEYGLGFALLIKDDNRKSTGGMNVGTNGGAYNKIYFGLCRNYSASTNDDLHATQVWEIEGKLIEET